MKPYHPLRRAASLNAIGLIRPVLKSERRDALDECRPFVSVGARRRQGRAHGPSEDSAYLRLRISWDLCKPDRIYDVALVRISSAKCRPVEANSGSGRVQPVVSDSSLEPMHRLNYTRVRWVSFRYPIENLIRERSVIKREMQIKTDDFSIRGLREEFLPHRICFGFLTSQITTDLAKPT
ncbi:hypothetical protein EVAR_88138_1 [Eumeta japonica]|uniref:Uncharacterized protein n=1 Tax=Eumeta variegata TaxID=151549 RepID=A0A4C1WT17_EUMVA|nr:hypothetical protein EVAR_88138_1 [Eumeta japonica]